MVVTNNFQEIYEAASKIPALNLPPHKENVLKIEFDITHITSCWSPSDSNRVLDTALHCTKKNQNPYLKKVALSHSGKVAKTVYVETEPPLPFARSDIFHADICDWRRLTTDDKDCKAVYEVSFDIKGSNFTFKPGDTIGVVPQNNKSEVDFIINHLNLTSVADSIYTLSINSGAKTKAPAHIPHVSTLRHVLTHCVDIRTVLKKLFLLALSRYTKEETQRRVLEYLCSKEGAAAYTTHILNKNISLLDLLTNFNSCQPPIEILLFHLPRLLPRPYSIVNSPLKESDILKICFSVIDTGYNRKGLTTGWIENMILNKVDSLEDGLKKLSLTNSRKIPIYLRKNVNCFEIPDKIDTPLILVGPGTGIAPFIGFLEHIECSKNVGSKENRTCQTWVFFGCRNPKLDFIYKKELQDFLEKNILSNLTTAFSRCDNSEQKYVQDAIMENGENVVQLIKEGAKIFVCGHLKTMAEQVKDTIVNCLVKYGGNTKVEADNLVCEMQQKKSYIVDIWN